MVLYVLVHPINLGVYVIHKTKMNVSFPGVTWAERMQATRDAMPAYDPKAAGEYVEFEGVMVEANVLFCATGSIKLTDMSGQTHFGSSVGEFEFVKYDKKRGLIIVALHVSDGEESDAFDALFPTTEDDRPYESDRAFLIIPAKNAKSVTAWVFAPSGKDGHSDYGASASTEYLERLMREARG